MYYISVFHNKYGEIRSLDSYNKYNLTKERERKVNIVDLLSDKFSYSRKKLNNKIWQKKKETEQFNLKISVNIVTRIVDLLSDQSIKK